ncbi:FtsX-like permease family protein [Geoglobus acetivorans]|uniref:FtsX-like permease family protein n=1 Tax=Geoglobus acetivorans TaxID=565033 RepID=A0ABZ3H0U9_GEOAI|nr:FtsX-like permease family protein [Geoglobus acetivorans]
MVAILHLKVLRDIKAQKYQFLAIIFLIVAGVGLFSAFYMAYLNLSTTYHHFYNEMDFEDLSATFLPVSQEKLEKVKRIDGIKDFVVRTTLYGIYERENREITLRFVTMPDEMAVNRLYLVEGRFPDKGENAILLLKNFADFHGIKPGEVIEATVEGKKVKFTVSGIVYSPEFLWIFESGSWITTPENFGVVFVNHKTLEKALGRELPPTEIHITVVDKSRVEEVINRVSDVIGRDNLITIYKREDQPSYRALKMDLDGFREMAIMFPALFYLISAMMIYILMSRLVREQRRVIAVLRATGYTKTEILIHYSLHSVISGIVGTAGGIVLGFVLSSVITDVYVSYLNIPYSIVGVYPDVILFSFVMGVGVPAFAGILTALSAAKVKPASALRGIEVKSEGIRAEKLFAVFSRASLLTKFAVRNMFRNPRRTVYSIFAVMSSVVLLLVSLSFVDATNYVLDTQFNEITTYNVKVKTGSEEIYSRIKKMGEVEEAIKFIEVGVVIEKDGKRKATVLYALPADQNLINIFDMEGRRRLPPSDGVVLPEIIAKELEISPGEEIYLTSSEFGKIKVKVSEIYDQPMIPAMYSDIDYFSRISGQKFNTVAVKFRDGMVNEGKTRISEIEGVRIDSVDELKDYIDQVMGLMYAFTGFALIFGGSIGFSAIFNTVTISVMERRVEIATLKMLGFTDGEIFKTLVLEVILMGFAGIVLGIPAGYYVAGKFFESFESELYLIPMRISLGSYAISMVFVLMVILLSMVPAFRYIRKMDIQKIASEFVG